MSSCPSHVSGTPPTSPLPSCFHDFDQDVVPELDISQFRLPHLSNQDLDTTCVGAEISEEGSPDGNIAVKQITPPSTQSRTAQLYMGRKTPTNTLKCNETALRALCSYVCDMPECQSLLLEGGFLQIGILQNTGYLLDAGRFVIFPNGKGGTITSGHTDWSNDELIRIRYYLIEFVVNYKTKTGTPLKPTTLKTYILGIQRGMNAKWGYDLQILSGDVFNCPKNGLFAVVDNMARELQHHGKHVQSHNVFSRDDLDKLFTSKSLSRDTPYGFQARLVFVLGIVTGMRPNALWTLTVSQFTQDMVDGKLVWKITGNVGSPNGSSKTMKGGWKAIGEKPPEVLVWDEDYLGGCVNFFKDIDEYLNIRNSLEAGTDRFFLGVNHRAVHRRDFFKRQHVGRNMFTNIVKKVCQVEGITGSGNKMWVTTHGLRGTLATLLFENGHSDSSVAMRTGHRDPRSLKSYQHLRGGEGIAQQRDILGFRGNNSDNKENKDGKDKEIVRGSGDSGLVSRKVTPNLPDGVVANPRALQSMNGNDTGSLSSALISNVGTVSGTINLTVNYYGRSS